jgi:hypothetical protein
VEEEENGSPKYVLTPRTTVVEHDVHASVAGPPWIGQGEDSFNWASCWNRRQCVDGPRPCSDESGTDKERRSAGVSKTSLRLCG